MDKFFSFIPGMSSRIGNHIDFPNYEVDELFEISKVMSRDLDYEMTDEAGDVFKKYIERRMAMPFFSNAPTAATWVRRTSRPSRRTTSRSSSTRRSPPRTTRSSLRRFAHRSCVYMGRRVGPNPL